MKLFSVLVLILKSIAALFLPLFIFGFATTSSEGVNTNSENIVIGDRAFGEGPQLVSDMAGAFLSALHSSGTSETWHIRYGADKKFTQKIFYKGINLEEYKKGL